jgi:hypothetical protein
MSSRPSVFRIEIIPIHRLQTDPVVCPACGGNDLILFGNMIYPHHEVLEAGVVVSKDTNWDIQTNFELLAVDCLRCETRFDIQSNENFILSRTNADLAEALRRLTGQGNKPC